MVSFLKDKNNHYGTSIFILTHFPKYLVFILHIQQVIDLGFIYYPAVGGCCGTWTGTGDGKPGWAARILGTSAA